MKTRRLPYGSAIQKGKGVSDHNSFSTIPTSHENSQGDDGHVYDDDHLCSSLASSTPKRRSVSDASAKDDDSHFSDGGHIYPSFANSCYCRPGDYTDRTTMVLSLRKDEIDFPDNEFPITFKKCFKVVSRYPFYGSQPSRFFEDLAPSLWFY